MCQTMVSIRVAATPAWRLILRPHAVRQVAGSDPPAARPMSSATTTAAATPATRRSREREVGADLRNRDRPGQRGKDDGPAERERRKQERQAYVANEPRTPAVQDDEGRAQGKRQTEGPGMLPEQTRDAPDQRPVVLVVSMA